MNSKLTCRGYQVGDILHVDMLHAPLAFELLNRSSATERHPSALYTKLEGRNCLSYVGKEGSAATLWRHRACE